MLKTQLHDSLDRGFTYRSLITRNLQKGIQEYESAAAEAKDSTNLDETKKHVLYEFHDAPVRRHRGMNTISGILNLGTHGRTLRDKRVCETM
jgi:hypothetical protein